MVNGEECEIAFFNYNDDILFVSKSEEEHLENLTAVFNRLEFRKFMQIFCNLHIFFWRCQEKTAQRDVYQEWLALKHRRQFASASQSSGSPETEGRDRRGAVQTDNVSKLQLLSGQNYLGITKNLKSFLVLPFPYSVKYTSFYYQTEKWRRRAETRKWV